MEGFLRYLGEKDSPNNDLEKEEINSSDLTDPMLKDLVEEKKDEIILADNQNKLTNMQKEQKKKQKELAELEAQMAIVQNSTRTLIPKFLRLHNYCRMRWRWYYQWSRNPYSTKVHWVVLACYIIGLTILFVSVLLAGPKFSRAASTCVVAATGNWNAGATWTGCGVNGPVAGDTVNINAAYTVTLTANAAAATVTVSAGTLAIDTYDLALSSTSTVSGGAVTIGASATTGWTTTQLTISSGSVTCSGASIITLTGSTIPFNKTGGTFTASGSTVKFTADAAITSVFYATAGTPTHGLFNVEMSPTLATAARKYSLCSNTCTLNIGGTLYINPNSTPSAYLLTVDNSYATTVVTGATTIQKTNNATSKLTTIGDITATFTSVSITIASGGALAPTGGYNGRIIITGNSGTPLTNNGTFTPGSYSSIYFLTDTAAVPFSGISNFSSVYFQPTLTFSRVWTIPALTVSSNFTILPTAASALSLTVNLSGTLNITASLGVQPAGSATSILNTTGSNYAVSAAKLIILAGGTVTANESIITLTGSTMPFDRESTGVFTAGTSTVKFTADAAIASVFYATASPTHTLFNVEISPTLATTARQYTLCSSSCTLQIGGTFNINPQTGAFLLTVAASSATLNVTGLTTIQKTGASTTASLTTAAGKTATLGALTIASGGTYAPNATAITTIAGDMSIASGGTYTKNGTFTFIGTTATTYEDLNASKQDLGTISLTKTNATPANNKLTLKTSGGNGMKVSILTISNNNTLDLNTGGYTLEIANAGATDTVFTKTGTLTPGTSTVKYSATNSGGNITITAATYNNLQINNAAENYTIGAGTVILNGDFTATAGTLIGTGTMYVNGGGATGDGTIAMTGGTFLLDGTGNFGGAANWTFFSLTFGDDSAPSATTTKTGANTITVQYVLTIAVNQALDAGDDVWILQRGGTPFVVNGTFTKNASTIRYTASEPTNITAANYWNLDLIDPPTKSELDFAAEVNKMLGFTEDPTSLASRDTSGIFESKENETEVISERTETSKTFSKGNNEYRLAAQVGPIHYKNDPQDSSEAFKEINLTIHQSISADYNYAMEQNGYQAYFWNQDYSAQYFQQNHWLKIKPLALEWQNAEGEKELISNALPTNQDPKINNDEYTLTYKNIFGNGIDYRYNLAPDHFFKTVIVNNENDLPKATISPEGLKLNVILGASWDDETVLGNNFANNIQISMPSNYDPNEKYDEILSNPDDYSNKDSQGRDIFWIRQPKAWDSSQDQKNLAMSWSLVRQGQNVFINLFLPAPRISNIHYPQFIDTAIAEEQTGASADDAVESLTGTTTINRSSDYITYNGSSYEWTGFRFTSIPISAGATVNSATLVFDVVSNDDPRATIFGQLSVSPAVFTAGAGYNISGRTMTPDSVFWNATDIGFGWKNTPSLTAVVQDIVNQGAWLSYSDIAFLVRNDYSDGLCLVYQWDASGNVSGAKFNATYTKGPGTYTLASDTFDIDGNLTIGNGTDTMSVTAATNNPIIDLEGNMSITANSTFIASNSAAFTITGGWSNAGTFTNSSGTITFDGGSNQSVTTGISGAFYNLTCANTSTSPGVTFVDGTSVSHLFKDITASAVLTFTAGTTSALNDIQLNGVAAGTRITIRSTAATAAGWNITKAAPQTDVSYVDVSWNDAHFGQEIDASDGTNNDGLNNINWDFGGVVLSISLELTDLAGDPQDTMAFGPLIPLDTIAGSTIAVVTTNYGGGYTLGASDGVAESDSCLLHTVDLSTRIADYTGTIDTPTLWTGTGFGISVYKADTALEPKWCGAVLPDVCTEEETDLDNNYAGVPFGATTIHTKAGTPTSGDRSWIGYKLVVPNTQKTGDYSGIVTYTATGVLP